ncbi:Ig-like domain-containing protein [Streptomyces sp. N2-109]|uniref:Ig-like domain-containing protein n=1 Tax=Streptomyces gossypii TaxID=2883101 RepID=A0ABT2JYI0_9ACTN|nr:Ig-like domain-containing protein [Streptomyces gossypii]MCT2592504.1 Ig-like domain-containing protein [Streptomyces gossypii]
MLNADAIREGNRGRVVGGSAAALAALLAVLLLVVTSCGGTGDSAASTQDGKDGKEQKKEVPKGPSEAIVKIAPKNGADDVATTGALKVTAAQGKLTKVTVKDDDGTRIPGKIVKKGAAWKPERHLMTKTEYSVHAVAEDAEGRTSAEHTSFTTIVPADTFIGYYTPDDGDKVGVGMPVSVRFNRPIADRESVEKALSVKADPGVKIEGHWFGNNRLDFRPEKYWKAGTKVTLNLHLDGVEGANGVYGTQHKTVKFTIGRAQVSVVDAKKKTMTVLRDGKKIKQVPISAGAPATSTYNGKMVISEKHEVTRMNGDTVGFGGEYDIEDVPHAMRLSTSGTFIHGNYWAGKATFGSANTSHGCIGLFDARGGGDKSTPAAWFYDNSLVGDIVEVKNSKDETIQPDNGFSGWNMDWEDWTAAP